MHHCDLGCTRKPITANQAVTYLADTVSDIRNGHRIEAKARALVGEAEIDDVIDVRV